MFFSKNKIKPEAKVIVLDNPRDIIRGLLRKAEKAGGAVTSLQYAQAAEHASYALLNLKKL